MGSLVRPAIEVIVCGIAIKAFQALRHALRIAW